MRNRLHNTSSAVIRRSGGGLWSGLVFFSVFGKCSTFVPGISSAAGVVESVHTVPSESHS